MTTARGTQCAAHKKGRALILAGALLAGWPINGCSLAPDRAPLKPTAAPALPPLRVPEALAIDEGRIRLPVATAPFLLSAADTSDPLPAAVVPTATLYDVGLLEALEQIFAAANVPITVLASPEVDATRLTIIQRRNVPLDRLVEQIAADRGFFYSYHDGVLRLSKSRSFSVSLPPIGGGAVVPASSTQATGGGTAAAGSAGAAPAVGNGGAASAKRIDEALDIYQPIAEALKALGADNVTASRFNRTIVFSAGRDRLPMIERYLAELRRRGKVVVLDCWIVDVQLNDGADVGIDWNKAQLNFGGGRPLTFQERGAGSVDGFSLGFTGAFGRVSLDVLANFLATQGTAQTVAAPRMVMLSGTRADFTQGENLPYVAAVQITPQTTTTGGALAGGNIVFANVGLAMSVVADAMEDSVFLGLGLRSSSLIDFAEFNFGTLVSKAPHTAERTYTAEVRLPVGEVVVINGIRQGQESVRKRQIPGIGEALPGIAGRDTEARTRSELVLVLRPRVIEYVPTGTAPPAPVPAWPGRAPALPLPDEGPAGGPPFGPGSARSGGASGAGVLDHEIDRDRPAPGAPLNIRPTADTSTGALG